MNVIRTLLTISFCLLLFHPANPLLAQADSEACLSCHDRPIKTKKRIIPNIKEKFGKAYSAHSFLQCLDCHYAHCDQPPGPGPASLNCDQDLAKRNPYMLIDSFPPYKHAAYIVTPTSNTYALCFRCHNVGMLDKKIENETDFYTVYWPFKKKINAHYSHVVRPKINNRADSAYSCAVCHDVHGSDMPKNVRQDALPGHTKLKYKISNNGGTCAGACHQGAKYQRD